QTVIQNERAPGPGYYDFLGVKDEKSFHQLIGFDEQLFKEKFPKFLIEMREAVGRSGVADQSRRIAAFDKLQGRLWATYDNTKATGNRNPLEVPDAGFAYDATEQFGHLANGMWAMGLFDSKGGRQNSAPDFVGHDRTSPNNRARIEINLS